VTPDELKARAKPLGLEIIGLVGTLPHQAAADVIGRQMLRSGTAVGAHYRAACRAQSQADFVSKLSRAEEEADETSYWLELLDESGLVKSERLSRLLTEIDELVAILTASRKTAMGR
jgi:four helix bundle protein